LSLVKIAIPEPAADEVVVRVEPTPINRHIRCRQRPAG
jgi:NADPH:quinone reductase-like Zn-dependent oxidoreductase